MKGTAQKSNVKIVVADDESLMRGIVLNALGAGGYRDIRSAGSLELLEQLVDGIYADLLIVSSEMADGNALEFVHRLRLSRVGRNPFVPIIMMAWNAEQSFVRKVIDSGADVLVTKPFAASQLYSKIDLLCSARQPFIVTSSYLGPDRRKQARGDDFPFFDVPNTLKERLTGEPFDPERLRTRIDGAFSDIMRQRRVFQEQDIQRNFTALVVAARDRKPVQAVKAEISAIIHAIKRNIEEHAASEPQSAARIDALVAVLRSVVDADDCVSLRDCDAVERLLGDLGIAVPSAVDSAVLNENLGLAAAC